jgi:hypothetical protein
MDLLIRFCREVLEIERTRTERLMEDPIEFRQAGEGEEFARFLIERQKGNCFCGAEFT